MDRLYNRNYLVVAVTGMFCLLSTSVVSAQTATDLNCSRCVGRGEVANNTVGWFNLDFAARTFLINQANDVNGFDARLTDQANTVNGFDARLDGNFGTLIVSKLSVSSAGFVMNSCPAHTRVTSATCSCTNGSGTRNFGVLFSCEVKGNGGVAGCFADAATFDPFLPEPQIDMTLTCLSGMANDGTPLFPFPVEILSLSNPGEQASYIGGVSGDQKDSPPSFQVSGSEDTELNAAFNLLQDQILDRRTALQDRQQ